MFLTQSQGFQDGESGIVGDQAGPNPALGAVCGPAALEVIQYDQASNNSDH